MIEWVYGESGVGKTTLARKIAASCPGTIHLGGDDMRRVWSDLGFSLGDRRKQNLRVAHLAKVLEQQGFRVVVSTVCPTKTLRRAVYKITGCTFIKIKNKGAEKKW